MRLAGNQRLRRVSLRGAEAEELLSDVDEEARLAQAWLVAPDGRRWGGAEAIWQSLYLSPVLNLLLRPLRLLPGFHPISRRVYRWVAAQRRYTGCRLDRHESERK